MARTITVGWEHDGAEYRVTGFFEPGHPGRGPSRDDPGEPPEGPGFDVTFVREDRPGGKLRPDLVAVAQATLDLVGEAQAAHRDFCEDVLDRLSDALRDMRREGARS